MNEPILNKIYKLSEFEKDWLKFLSGPFHFSQIPLPTEVVVREPRYVVPDFARIYKTNLFFSEDNTVVSDKEIREKYTKPVVEEIEGGTSKYYKVQARSIHLAEQWVDGGSDGHIEPFLSGYRFIIFPTEKEWEKFSEKNFMRNEVSSHIVYESDWFERDGLGKNPYGLSSL